MIDITEIIFANAALFVHVDRIKVQGSFSFIVFISLENCIMSEL